MKRRHVIALIAVVSCIVSCSSTVIMYASSYTFDYLKTPLTCAVLFPEIIEIAYPGNVDNIVGEGEKSQMITTFLRSQIITELQQRTIFNRVWNTFLLEEFEKRKVYIKSKGGEKTFSIPTPDARIACQGGIPDIVLTFDDIEIKTDDDPEKNAEAVSADVPPQRLIVQTKFIIWDNKQHLLVSHGFIVSEVTNKRTIAKEDWNTVIADICAKILERTPYKKS